MTKVWSRARGLVEAAGVNFFWSPSSHHTVQAALEEWAAERPGDELLWFEGQRWTVGEVNSAVNRHARAYRALGLRAGDVVALLMDNRPAFLFHFYALLKLGVVASLINTNLRGTRLAKTVLAGGPRLLVSSELSAPQLAELDEGALGELEVWFDAEQGPATAGRDFALLAAQEGSSDLPQTRRGTLADLAAFIFTSGTTGLPKPALVKSHRLYRAGRVFGGILGLTKSDCLYLCLPLYHGNASMIGVPMAITHRCRLALARRLSVSRFWDDCRDAGATAFVYVGELCRYLMNAPEGPGDRAHGVRAAIGNGLRPNIWEAFLERFGLERVHEFYAATEGNAESINILGFVGSCGVLFPWKMAVVRYDLEAGAPIRDEVSGACRHTRAGEPGLLIGKIGGKNEYVGYSDVEATRKKVLRDVFRRGDAWFDTGDLVRRDRLLNLYFVDRLGDTFRWKGENVSTQEVAEVLSEARGVVEANVYGVEVPGQEGRAGMAALVIDEDFDEAAFSRHVSERLPGYAQPRFLRIVPAMELTGTFRQRKGAFQRQGFGPEVTDPLWLRDPEAGSYRPLDDPLRAAVARGEWPL